MDPNLFVYARVGIVGFHKIMGIFFLVTMIVLAWRTRKIEWIAMAAGFLLLGGFTPNMYLQEGQSGWSVLGNVLLIDVGMIVIFCGLLFIRRAYLVRDTE